MSEQANHVEQKNIEVELTLWGKALLDNKLVKLNKRAAKLGLRPVSVEQVTPWERKRVTDDGEIELSEDLATFSVSVEIPRLNGFRFLATLDHTESGNLIKVNPTLGAEIDLTPYRTCAPFCQHCNKVRSRKDTYVIEGPDSRRIQVGSSCLSDVLGLGVTPEQAAEWASWVQHLESTFSSAEDADYDPEGFGGRTVNSVPLKSYLDICAALIRIDGYRSKKYSESTDGDVCTTAADAWFHFFPPRGLESNEKRELVERYGSFPVRPTEEDCAKAQKAIEWAKSLEPRSDFDWNLKTVSGSEMLATRNGGIAAYIVAGYIRHTEREIERAAKEAAMPESFHVGEIGKRIKKAKVKYLATPFAGENDFGAFFIHRFCDESGNELVWKTSSGMNEAPGTEFVASFTPKQHSEFKGRKQTVVSRMALK